MQNTNATVVVLGTGGTIAGLSAPGQDERHYQAGVVPVDELLSDLLGLSGALLSEQVAQLDSKDMSVTVWQRLADRVAHHLASPHVAGVVVTHGTDTLEETAYLLQRLLAPVKPVVLTAAMRPASAAAPDGPGNLRDAVTVARDGRATGVLAVMAGAVYAARDVRKVHTSRLDAFEGGDAGPLAHVADHAVTWRRSPPVDEPLRDWTWPATPADWPRVEVVTSHAGADGVLVQAVCAAGCRGIVVAGTGNGTLHADLVGALRDAEASGVTVWRSTRCAGGDVTTHPGDPFPGTGDLTPPKARIALQLALLARRSGSEPGA